MKVAWLMGSDSDLPTLEKGFEALRELGIEVEARVLSAHRTPHQVVEFVESAPQRGVRAFLCAAGAAAHLAGVVAAHTDLPVLGIPIPNPPFNGLDSLYSTVQMPGGVPVATFGVGSSGALNAALFAARILALSDEGLHKRLVAYREGMTKTVLEKDARLQAKLSSS